MDINQARNGHAIGNDIHHRRRRRVQDGAYMVAINLRATATKAKHWTEVVGCIMGSVAKQCAKYKKKLRICV